MELTPYQLQALARTATDPVSLEQSLLTAFPDTTITVIRGLDRFAGESYTNGAYFSEAAAREAMAAIPPNGSADLADVYHLLSGTVRELRASTPFGPFTDQRTRQPLDGFDRQMVYASLLERLSPESSPVRK